MNRKLINGIVYKCVCVSFALSAFTSGIAFANDATDSKRTDAASNEASAAVASNQSARQTSAVQLGPRPYYLVNDMDLSLIHI